MKQELRNFLDRLMGIKITAFKQTSYYVQDLKTGSVYVVSGFIRTKDQKEWEPFEEIVVAEAPRKFNIIDKNELE